MNNGDKVATLHGQKAVVLLWPPQDMPWVVSKGKVIPLDMIVSITSITKRGTLGQIAEAGLGIRALDQGRRITVEGTSTEVCDHVGRLVDGRTGSSMQGPSGHETDCTWGAWHVMATMHMVDDKQHYTHTASPVVPTRAGGGGVSMGEMEQQMLLAHGLPAVVQELRSRQSNIDVDVCIQCKRVVMSCKCMPQSGYIPMRVPSL